MANAWMTTPLTWLVRMGAACVLAAPALSPAAASTLATPTAPLQPLSLTGLDLRARSDPYTVPSQ